MKILKHSLLCLLFIFSQTLTAQDTNILDSIKREFDKADDSLKAEVYLNLSINYRLLNQDQSLDFHKYVYDYAVSTNNTAILIKALIRIAESYYRMNYYDESLDYALQSLDFVLDTKDTSNFYDSYAQLGSVFSAIGQYDAALEYFQESDKYLERSGDPRNEISSLANMAEVLSNTGNNKIAMEKYKRAIELSKQLNFNISIGSLYVNLGNLYRDYSNQTDSAEFCYSNALSFYSLNKRKVGYFGALINLGKLYLKINSFDKAKKYIEESLLMAEETGSSRSKRDASLLMSDLYSRLGNYNLAYIYHLKYSRLNDSLLNVRIISDFSKLQAKYESERLYQEGILVKNAETDQILLRKQRTFIVLFICIIIILIVFAVVFVYQNRLKGRLVIKLSNSQKELQKKNSELEKSNKTKDKFFSILAHDLKTPFNSIIGFSQLLIDNAEKDGNSQNLKFANHIHSSGEKTLKLIDKLLQWFGSRIGRVNFKPESFPIQDIIDTNIEFYKDIVSKKNISLINKDNVNEIVYADINMINTVLRNLVSNALKFTYSKGTVSLHAIRQNDEVKISVVDNGTGIKKEMVSTLFDIESKFSTIGTEGETGTGFGLALVKEFVEKNNGRVWVESENGKGSKFHFTLPAGK